eukprot:246402-Chlamydomonas_euryale.AAC.3
MGGERAGGAARRPRPAQVCLAFVSAMAVSNMGRPEPSVDLAFPRLTITDALTHFAHTRYTTHAEASIRTAALEAVHDIMSSSPHLRNSLLVRVCVSATRFSGRRAPSLPNAPLNSCSHPTIHLAWRMQSRASLRLRAGLRCRAACRCGPVLCPTHQHATKH